VPITYGTNQINVTVYDTYTNTASALTTINRVAGQHGAVVIVGGHNNSNSVQANINYASNRAYNIFRQSGYGVEDIMYLSPGALDADGDGVSDVISPTTPANVHAALQWAAGRVGPGVPFYLYLMDHGEIESFCADGCDAGAISPTTLNTWLTELETTSGADQVNVIIEACHSGSFIDRFPGDPITSSISQNKRVVIASTGRTNNAYASAQGAYFSDAFFSAVAESKSLLTAFNQAAAAVDATPFNQTPWLDDNGDGLSNPTDGAFAGNRYIANFFGGSLPQVKTVTVTVASGVGALSARVEQGNDSIDVVWAAIYAPSFQEPLTTTLYLGVPLVQLQPDLDHPGVYRTNYNGFGEHGTYKVVFYAADTAGNQALPKVKEVGGSKVYLPIVIRR
jgi:hypothetical protein